MTSLSRKRHRVAESEFDSSVSDNRRKHRRADRVFKLTSSSVSISWRLIYDVVKKKQK